MPDSEWVENIMQIARKSIQADGLCDVVFGCVTSTSPLKVQISQKLTLGEKQLIVPKSLTDYMVQMELPELGEVSVTVKNGLKPGEHVLLLQKQGKQQYVILDRR